MNLSWIHLVLVAALVHCHASRLSRLLPSCKTSNGGGPRALKQDRRRGRDSLSVATYNTYWLVDPERLPTHPFARYSPWSTAMQARMHVRDVAEVLVEVAADVVVLTEIQSQGALDLLLADVNEQAQIRGEAEYRAFLMPNPDEEAGMNVGLLSRVDPTGPLHRVQGSSTLLLHPWCGDPNDEHHPTTSIRRAQLNRSFYCDFDICDAEDRLHRFTLFGVHLQVLLRNRKLGALLRSAQSLILVSEMSRQHGRGREVIVAGDLNDVDPQLGGVRAKSHGRAVEIIKRGAEGMWNPAILLPPTSQYSCRSRMLIDHVLVETRRPVRKMHIYHQPEAKAASDHYAVKAELDLVKEHPQKSNKGDS